MCSELKQSCGNETILAIVDVLSLLSRRENRGSQLDPGSRSHQAPPDLYQYISQEIPPK
jgi:hypothetical protein